MIRGCILVMTLASLSIVIPTSKAVGQAAAERGEKALLGRGYLPPAWSLQAYQSVWRHWSEQAQEAPRPYAEAVMKRYGLHPAPFPNGGYPMGLRVVTGLFTKGLTNDCLLCHAGSIAGQSYVGLGNASLDFQALFEDFNAAEGRPPKTPFVFSNVRGTTEAGAMAVFLLSFREPTLKVRVPRLDLGLQDNLCEDVPAWWLLKKKKTMYYTGSSDARSVRSLMQFMLNPLNGPATFEKEEATFADIQAYLLSLKPPRYPFPIDEGLAHRGEKVFRTNCSKCHGTYGEHWTYPNKIVPLEVIGTDRARFEGFTERSGQHYNKSWFAQEKKGWLQDDYPAIAAAGYQAPPLDGIWATAPYFHNGSVPTVHGVLNSKLRPQIYTRSFGTDKDDYDPVELGWKVRVLERGPEAEVPAFERRKVYDTRLAGRGNSGHTFGDDLTEEDRMAVIEYLKSL
jgi:cytochrome c2